VFLPSTELSPPCSAEEEEEFPLLCRFVVIIRFKDISLFNGKISVINSFLKGHDIKIIEPIINKKISII
jgi:hypothetical protein